MALAVRCAHAQYFGGGGVLSMAKGTALFDAVAISGSQAGVRASRAGCPHGVGVGGRGARADCNGRGCAGCAQYGGGVVRMVDGAVTFKGGSISNSTAVRVRLSRSRVPRHLVLGPLLLHGAVHALRDEWCWHGVVCILYGLRCMPPAWSVCEASCIIGSKVVARLGLAVLYS